MEPVRVKVYGLLSLTRRGYLTLLALGLAALGAVLLARLLLPLPRPSPEAQRLAPGARAWAWVLDYFPWVVLAAIVCEAVEAVFVLRRFAREEARRRAALPESPPPPLNPEPRE